MALTQFGTVNTTALAEYFIKKYNMVGRDAEYGKNRPTLSWVPRDTERLKQGDGFFETLKIGAGFSMSPGWQIGNLYHNPSTKVRWAVGDPYAQYGFVSFDNLALNRNNLGTLIDIKSSEADDVKEGMLNTAEFEMWNDGTGNRGQASAVSGTTTIVITLAVPSDVYNFEYGMMIYGDTATIGSGGTTHTENYRVSDLDPQGGKVTAVRTTGGGGSALAANDFIFTLGSAGASATTPVMMPGIPTFIPSAAPADTLLGVTRTANPATSGWRFPFKASISETIQRAFSFMGRWVNRSSGRFMVVLSTTDWLYLSMERESRVVPDPTAVQKWGLEGLTVRTAYGPITCVSVPQLKDGRGYIIDWTSWKLYTLKNLPHVIDEDGQTFVRGREGAPDTNANGDFIKMQFRLWKFLLCLKPMSNATFLTA